MNRVPVQARTHPSEPERCDRSYAERAQYRVTSRVTGHSLTLCKHHMDAYQATIIGLGWTVEEIA